MPLGPEEQKHLAIAAVCGTVVGALAGAVGYHVVNRVTPSPSRRNSCTSCIDGTSPKHGSLRLPLKTGHGDQPSQHGLSTPDPAVTSKALEELTKRMESLEQAVRSRLLSRSGTASSLTGYLTAPESNSDDEEFEDVGEESSGGEDIFFHSSTTPKSVKSKSSTSSLLAKTETDPKAAVSDPQQAPAEAVTVAQYYIDIDKCLCSDLSEENNQAHEQLTNMRDNDPKLDSDPNYLWRFGKSVHQKGLSTTDVEGKKVLAFRAKELAFQALSSAGGESISDVHKWCAITIGNIGDYVSLQEKISNGAIFKERIDSAIGLNNKDEMSFYLLGRWCYSIYMMTWVERKVATSLCSDFPSATIDEALVAFQNSEAIKPCHWIDNQLYLAKCYIEKSDYATAMTWLDKAVTLEIKPEDSASKQEVDKLINKYSYYRQSS